MQQLMTAEQILADRTGWLERRRNLITGSDIAAIMGVNPQTAHTDWATPSSVYWEKVTGTERPDRMVLAKGRHDEQFVADLYAGRYPDVHRGYLPAGSRMVPGGLYIRPTETAPPDGWAGATFDRLEVDAHGHVTPIEIKTSISWDGYGDPPHGDMPVRILAQAIWQGWIADAERVKVAVFKQPFGPLRVYWVDMIAPDVTADLAVMIHTASKFLFDNVLAEVPPPLDWLPATEAALKLAYRMDDTTPPAVIPAPLRDKVWKAQAAADKATERLGLAKNELREAMGSAKKAVDWKRTPIASRSISYPRRVDLDQLRADFPEVAAKCTRQADDPVDKLLIRRRGVTA